MNNHLDPYGYKIPEIFYGYEDPYDANFPLHQGCPCQIWLDGQDAPQFSLNGNKVIQWDDKGLLAAHVANGADATRPTYDPITGRVTFIAANDTFLRSAAFGSDLSVPNTVFVVYKTNSVAATQFVFDGILWNKACAFYYGISTFRFESGIQIFAGATNANDNIHCVQSGTDAKYWINGVLKGAGNAGAEDLTGITLGCSRQLIQHADCEIMEVIVYNCNLPANDRNLLTAWLGAKWGIAV